MRNLGADKQGLFSVALSLRRYSHDVRPLNTAVIAEQQKIADVFSDLKLIPRKISVRDAAPLLK